MIDSVLYIDLVEKEGYLVCVHDHTVIAMVHRGMIDHPAMHERFNQFVKDGLVLLAQKTELVG